MKVLILGRKNVGKSSLFNRLVKKKKALVINEEGITRDLLKDETEWWSHKFTVIDSGGLPEKKEKDELSLKILDKIQQALEEAEAFIVVVDGKSGLQDEDARAVALARKRNKPFLLFVNKIDKPKDTDLLTAPFFKLSSQLLSGSFERNYGVDEIVEWIISQKKSKKLFEEKKQEVDSQKIKQQSFKDKNIELSKVKKITPLFVIGRANSGKSLLCNQILKMDRMIVSSQSGTTLDTVTEFFSYKQRDYSISDNPGSRRGSREEREKISFAKSRSELEKADIVILVLDVLVGAGRQEARLVKLCLEKNKPVLLAVNKMDLMKSFSKEEKKQKQEEIKRVFHFYPDLPMVFISAKTGYHKDKLFKTIESLIAKINFRVSTSELNNFFSKVIRQAPAPVYGVSDVKFYYVNQTKRKPPEFIAFANYPKGVTPAYRRFIINKMKEKWSLQGVPISFQALSKR